MQKQQQKLRPGQLEKAEAPNAFQVLMRSLLIPRRTPLLHRLHPTHRTAHTTHRTAPNAPHRTAPNRTEWPSCVPVRRRRYVNILLTLFQKYLLSLPNNDIASQNLLDMWAVFGSDDWQFTEAARDGLLNALTRARYYAHVMTLVVDIAHEGVGDAVDVLETVRRVYKAWHAEERLRDELRNWHEEIEAWHSLECEMGSV